MSRPTQLNSKFQIYKPKNKFFKTFCEAIKG